MVVENRMDTVLRAFGRNRLSSDTDQDKSIGKNEHASDTPDASLETKNRRDRILSSTNSEYDKYDDDGDLIQTIPEESEDNNASENKEDEKRMHVSIDCTKALVILGFSNWSELEPGE